MSDDRPMAVYTRVGLVLLVVGLIGSLLATPAEAYTPESPEVRALLDRAVKYLESQQQRSFQEGGHFLAAMAIMKATGDDEHPIVKVATEKALKMVEKIRKEGVGGTCYSEGILCYFLCELNPQRYRQEISDVLQAMLRRQRKNGCWGYEPHTYDDTSQTQYGVLCLWAAHQHGVPVPVQAVEAVAQWLMRVQDVSGGWTYSPTDFANFQRRPQGSVTHSMSAAGLSSAYICSYLLGFTVQNRDETKPDDGLPAALVRVETEEEKKQASKFLRPTSTSRQMMDGAQAAGNAWFAKNLQFDVEHWTHYYMYAFERYKAFQELTEGKSVAEPDWYNKGVEYLRKTQANDGSWKTARSHGSNEFIDTAFAVLFLTRSSQSSIRKAVMDEGTLVGGKGLPKNLANARLVDGQVVTPQMVRDVDDLLEMLGKTEDKQFDATQLPGGLTLDQDLDKRTSQLVRLREMVTDQDFQKRMAAVKTLAASHDLDNVPALIFALSDPDARIVREARDGLRLISRKFQGFGLPASPTPQQVTAAQRQWKDWYLSICPDGVFLD
ncbi:MAG: hypothetical protein KJ000_00940 [Pirellulaceae bacterium]|nr:hypothetical protein [Pirellulaceae bacterium]